MLNKDINREIQRANFQGKLKEEIKPIYIRRNAFGVSVDSDVYRIFQAHHFLEDIRKSEISLVNIHPLVFGDPYENPLLDKPFRDGSGELLTLNGIVENYYGLSWTEEETDEEWRWKSFTHGKHGVRVKVSLLKLLNEINNVEDNFFMLHYFVGKVIYHDASEIDDWVTNSHYIDFLDSLGQISALSLTKLRDDFEDEKEIRILYSYMPNDNDFVKNRVKLSKIALNIVCKHPFNWNGIVEEVLVDPRMSKQEFESYKTDLNNSGISCDIRRSLVCI
jgi:hypothetical protein